MSIHCTTKRIALSILMIFFFGNALLAAEPVIYFNQVGLDSRGPKVAVLSIDSPAGKGTVFTIIDAISQQPVFTGALSPAIKIADWLPGKLLYQMDFSSFKQPGDYKISVQVNGTTVASSPFVIEENALAKLTIPAILHYYRKQRANTPAEWSADSRLLLYGSDETVDLRGGWCDASGDVSKYFSHLAYTNFMMPQQTPLVTWSMVAVADAIPGLLQQMKMKDSLEEEALWGADYIMRSLSAHDYFYMTVFSYFKPDPSARRVVGLLANSVTTNQYQCAFREGGGMAIGALARISR